MTISSHLPAIETQDLRKVFGDKVAVAGLTMSVEQGEVFGFLGPNGAGKTTAMKMLLGLTSPTAGSGSILGSRIGDYRVRARVGFLPEHFRFHDWLTANEFLKLHADLYQMPKNVTEKRVPELLEMVGLTMHATKKLKAYSKGMLQRIGLAQALLNDPDLVLLDEPTSGLDPVGRRLVRDIIHDLSNQGTTVFLNSHLLSEVEITCDRVAFIKHGEVLRTSHLDTIVDGEFTVEVRARNLNPEIIAGLSKWSLVTHTDGELLSLTLDHEDNLPRINRYLVDNDVDIYALRPERISLEDLFIQIVGTDGGL
jgi:ABC-2 type transport system ATP-binding protein